MNEVLPLQDKKNPDDADGTNRYDYLYKEVFLQRRSLDVFISRLLKILSKDPEINI